MPEAEKIFKGCKTQVDQNWVHALPKLGSLWIDENPRITQGLQGLCEHKHQRRRDGSLENDAYDIPSITSTKKRENYYRQDT